MAYRVRYCKSMAYRWRCRGNLLHTCIHTPASYDSFTCLIVFSALKENSRLQVKRLHAHACLLIGTWGIYDSFVWWKRHNVELNYKVDENDGDGNDDDGNADNDGDDYTC